MKRTMGAFMFTCLISTLGAEAIGFRIAAAANLSGTLNRAAEAFVAARPDLAVDIAFGSSGALAAQIRSGAPYDLFLSADTANPDRLAAEGFASGKSSIYALGVLCVAGRLGVDTSGSLAFLADPKYRTVAIAKPELAPYGAAAVEALKGSGVWLSVESRVVYGTNIAQVGQFVSTGAADVGFVNLSAALADAAFAKIPWARVDASLYTPIRQAAIVVARGDEKTRTAARAFLDFLLRGDGRAILENAGYGLPGLSAAAAGVP